MAMPTLLQQVLAPTVFLNCKILTQACCACGPQPAAVRAKHVEDRALSQKESALTQCLALQVSACGDVHPGVCPCSLKKWQCLKKSMMQGQQVKVRGVWRYDRSRRESNRQLWNVLRNAYVFVVPQKYDVCQFVETQNVLDQCREGGLPLKGGSKRDLMCQGLYLVPEEECQTLEEGMWLAGGAEWSWTDRPISSLQQPFPPPFIQKPSSPPLTGLLVLKRSE